MIGVAGSVAVGKSTTARVLQQMLAHWPEHPSVALVTTDGFLLPQRRARAPRHCCSRKGFPESYDRRALLRFVDRHQVRQGRGRGAGLLPPGLRRRPRRAGRRQAARHRDHRGPQRAAAGAGRAPTAAPAWRSATSSTSPSTSTPRTADIRQWYVERFLRLRETAFRDPASYFPRYAGLTEDEAVAEAAADLGRDQRPEPDRRTCCPPAAGPRWCCARTPTTRSATSGCASSDPVRHRPGSGRRQVERLVDVEGAARHRRQSEQVGDQVGGLAVAERLRHVAVAGSGGAGVRHGPG